MSRATALRLSTVMLIMAAGAVLVAPWSEAAVAGVAVRDSSFAPERLPIDTHDSVIFGRDSQLDHSITSDDNAFPEQEFPADRKAVGFRFNTPGTYAYHCKYHGGPGGVGMSGVIVVSDPGQTTSSTTTTTEPPPSSTSTSSSSTSSTTTTTAPTTTTRPPTTTTTAPPSTTTTEPPSTTTTEPLPIITPPPAVPPASSPDTTGPPNPPTTSAERKKSGGKSSTTSTSAKSKAAAAAGTDPSTTTSIQPPDQPEALVDPVDSAALPTMESVTPSTESVPPVQTLDDLALGRLTAKEEKLPRRDRSGFMVGAGIAMAVFLLLASGWAWYHRPSRYLPA